MGQRKTSFLNFFPQYSKHEKFTGAVPLISNVLRLGRFFICSMSNAPYLAKSMHSSSIFSNIGVILQSTDINTYVSITVNISVSLET